MMTYLIIGEVLVLLMLFGPAVAGHLRSYPAPPWTAYAGFVVVAAAWPMFLLMVLGVALVQSAERKGKRK